MKVDLQSVFKKPVSFTVRKINWNEPIYTDPYYFVKDYPYVFNNKDDAVEFIKITAFSEGLSRDCEWDDKMESYSNRETGDDNDTEAIYTSYSIRLIDTYKKGFILCNDPKVTEDYGKISRSDGLLTFEEYLDKFIDTMGINKYFTSNYEHSSHTFDDFVVIYDETFNKLNGEDWENFKKILFTLSNENDTNIQYLNDNKGHIAKYEINLTFSERSRSKHYQFFVCHNNNFLEKDLFIIDNRLIALINNHKEEFMEIISHTF